VPVWAETRAQPVDWYSSGSSPPKKGVLRIFSPLKIWRLRPGLNPRTWVLKASTLPLDHRSRYRQGIAYKYRYKRVRLYILIHLTNKLRLPVVRNVLKTGKISSLETLKCVTPWQLPLLCGLLVYLPKVTIIGFNIEHSDSIRAGRFGIESRWRRDFRQPSRPALGSTQPPIQWVPGLSRG